VETTTTTIEETTTSTVVETSTSVTPSTRLTTSLPETTVPQPSTTEVAQPSTTEKVPSPETTTTTQITPTTVNNDTSTISEQAAVNLVVVGQIVATLTSPEDVAELTSEEAEELFSEINTEVLNETQIQQLTIVLNDAPSEVKEAFEKTIDIFGEGFDDYVPLGSSISVAQRRTVVGVTAVSFMMPTPVPASAGRKQ